jgi:hypothetical protein
LLEDFKAKLIRRFGIHNSLLVCVVCSRVRLTPPGIL